MVVSLKPSSAAGYDGILQSIDQGGATIPLDSVRVDGTVLRFALAPIGARYEGKLDAAQASLVGIYTQNGQPQPLTLTLAAALEMGPRTILITAARSSRSVVASTSRNASPSTG